MKSGRQVEVLGKLGVIMPNPAAVEVGDEVDPARISPGVVLHPGVRISGKETAIGPDCELGREGPVVMENGRLGRNVKLKGGYFSRAVFWDGASMGSGAHVREGTLFEEQASGAHSVGLKQTLLMPFVTLGSQINFCDVFMAGGTSRRDHSEVGSSYIHFNYTPHQDKATASLIGDVPKGVFLKERPIFLGGQGGLVGPARIAYGSVIAAGGVCRQSLMAENQLHIPTVPEPMTKSYETGVYRSISRLVKDNLCYIGNMIALREWYRNVRSVLMRRDRFDIACYEGATQNLTMVLEERIKRLGELSAKMEDSIATLERREPVPTSMVNAQHAFLTLWPEIEFELLQNMWPIKQAEKDRFLAEIDHIPVGNDYVKTIQSLRPETREAGQMWLQSIVDAVSNLWPPNKEKWEML